MALEAFAVIDAVQIAKVKNMFHSDIERRPAATPAFKATICPEAFR